MASFGTRLAEAIDTKNSLLCVGLDPDVQRIPAHLREHPDAVYRFCHDIIAATHDLAAAFKPNIAFFEALGAGGVEVLARVMALSPSTLWILDAKRGDIGNTAAAYASAAFDYLNADAITLNPYLGGDSLEPFLTHPERGSFLLCRTSNPGSTDLQELVLADGRSLYLAVAQLAQQQWNGNDNVGLVVGATQPAALATVRAHCPDLPILLPGVGAQGGDLQTAVTAGIDRNGRGLLVNVSRSVLYAASDRTFAHAARTEALRMRDAINAARP
jgi:orotidine-5'-phosphate decarboxylase